MRVLMPIITLLLLSGCDDRKALCDKAVDSAMKGKASYQLFEVISDEDERPVEGKGVSQYKYIYRYYNNNLDLVVGAKRCIYDDGGQEVEIYGQKEFIFP